MCKVYVKKLAKKESLDLEEGELEEDKNEE